MKRSPFSFPLRSFSSAALILVPLLSLALLRPLIAQPKIQPKLVKEIVHERDVKSCAFSPDGKLLATSCSGTDSFTLEEAQGLFIRDAKTGGVLWSKNGKNTSLGMVTFSPDGKWLAGCDSDGKAKLLDLTTRKFQEMKQTEHAVRWLSFSPDSKKLAGGYNRLQIWDIATGKLDHVLEGNGYIQNAAWSPDGKTLAGCCPQHIHVWLWDPATGKVTRRINTRDTYFQALRYLPGGTKLVGATSRYVVIDEKKAWTFWVGGAGDITFKRQEAVIIMGSLCVHDLKTWKEELRIDLTEYDVDTLSVSADGKRAAIGLRSLLEKADRQIKVYDLTTGTLLWSWTDPQLVKATYLDTQVAISPDGRYLAACAEGQTIRLWDLDPAK